MKYLSKIVFGVTLAGAVAVCAVATEPVNTAPVPTTPIDLARQLTDLLKELEVTGASIMSVNGWNIACACVPTAQPNRPPPPSPLDLAAVKRSIAALQAMERAIELNEQATIQAGR